MPQGRPSTLSVLFDLFVANQRVRALLETAMHGAGMRADEYAVHSAIFELGPLSPTALSRALGMPPTTLTHYLDAMRAAGHLHQRPNPRDGRSYVVRLSLAGLAAHRRASRAFEVAYAPFVALLDEPEAVRGALRSVAEAASRASLESADRRGAVRG